MSIEGQKYNSGINVIYNTYLNSFLLNLPDIVRPGAEKFFESTYSNIQYDENLNIEFAIKKKQILWIFVQLNDIFDKEIINGIKKNRNDEHCLKEFNRLCEEASLAIQGRKHDISLCDKIINEFNKFCSDGNFLNLYRKIMEYRNDSKNFK